MTGLIAFSKCPHFIILKLGGDIFCNGAFYFGRYQFIYNVKNNLWGLQSANSPQAGISESLLVSVTRDKFRRF
jgi:hypothetical protein